MPKHQVGDLVVVQPEFADMYHIGYVHALRDWNIVVLIFNRLNFKQVKRSVYLPQVIYKPTKPKLKVFMEYCQGSMSGNLRDYDGIASRIAKGKRETPLLIDTVSRCIIHDRNNFIKSLEKVKLLDLKTIPPYDSIKDYKWVNWEFRNKSKARKIIE